MKKEDKYLRGFIVYQLKQESKMIRERNKAITYLKEEFNTTYNMWTKEELEERINNYLTDRNENR